MFFSIHNIVMDDKALIKELIEKNAKLEEELLATKEHLKKYTAPASRKEYYEKNKEAVIERVKNHKKNTGYKPTPEQKKEYNRQAYLKRKEKIQKEQNENI